MENKSQIIRNDTRSTRTELMRAKAHHFLNSAGITDIKKTTSRGSHKWESDGIFHTNITSEFKIHFHILMRVEDSDNVAINRKIYDELSQKSEDTLLILSDVRKEQSCGFAFFKSAKFPVEYKDSSNSYSSEPIALIKDSNFIHSASLLNEKLRKICWKYPEQESLKSDKIDTRESVLQEAHQSRINNAVIILKSICEKNKRLLIEAKAKLLYDHNIETQEFLSKYTEEEQREIKTYFYYHEEDKL